MFDRFKENLQKKLVEYQKQVSDANQKNINSASSSKSSTLSVLIWSMTFAILINYFFFNNSKNDNSTEHITENIQYVKYDKIKFVEKNNLLSGKLNKNGVTLDDIELLKYKDGYKNNLNIKTLSPVFSDKGEINDLYSFVKFGFKNAGTNKFYVDLPDDDTTWKMEPSKGSNYTFYWTNNLGFKFYRTFNFNNGYLFKVTDTIINNSKSDVALIPYKIVQQSINSADIDNSSLSGAIIITDEKIDEINYKTIENKNIVRISTNNKSAIGFTNNYFANILVSEKPVDISIRYNKTLSKIIKKNDKTFNIKNFQIELSDINPITIKQNEKYSYDFHIFSGAKQIDLLTQYANQLSMPRFNMLVDYGTFFFIARPATALLRFLNKYFDSMSIAIILFAIVMKVILLPLAMKQMKTTYKMQKMAPELKRIQTYYANNKIQQQMQIAMLYKKHGINPFTLFTQLLIQIPIFLAMWRALIVTIEMRHSKFLWINDLTSRDPIFVLPVLLGITMLLQMKLQNKGGVDDTNPGAKATKYMPYIMTVMFAFLPSGLILYYVVGNILGIIQQEVAKYYWNKNKCN